MHNPTASDYYSGKESWIRDKKKFRSAMIITGILTIISIRYPGTRPLYEEALHFIRIPTSFSLFGSGTLNYTSLIFLGFALRALFLIWDSLNRHRILFCLALIWLLPAASSAILSGYQMVIPSSVYALKVDQEQANCNYTLNDGRMNGQCSFTIKNNSNRAITVEQTGSMSLGGIQDDKIDFSLGSITIGARESRHASQTFSVPLPGPADQQPTGSGHVSLSPYGFTLEMNDGKRERIWGN